MALFPYGRQDINEEDIDAVVEVLRQSYLTQGPKVPEFEQVIASYCEADHAIAVNSGTSALHIACLALGLGEGDLLWTTPNTFVASANCALYCGADVDFVDIDPKTYNMSAETLADKLKHASCLPKIVVPVHFSGQPCDMEAIYKLSNQYGFYVLEDASHAIGARYQNESVGSCRYSDITVFSFHPVKIITTGEGGMALTNNAELAERMFRLRSHGITSDPDQMTNEPHGPWYYQQVGLGFNYRMTDIQAALGLSQIRRLDDFILRRSELAERYHDRLRGFPIHLPAVLDDRQSSWHLFVIQLELSEIKKSHREIFEDLREAGYGIQLHYIPVYLHPYYQKLGFSSGYCPETERYYKRAFSIPLFPAMTDNMQDDFIAVLGNILS
jgi:UDP-4-amino-4,6-dideoxy-N-acetyl-beta-L-altrosamine transaminase